eukprot:29916-Pelagococcus_subviridis.AAC.11
MSITHAPASLCTARVMNTLVAASASASASVDVSSSDRDSASAAARSNDARTGARHDGTSAPSGVNAAEASAASAAGDRARSTLSAPPPRGEDAASPDATSPDARCATPSSSAASASHAAAAAAANASTSSSSSAAFAAATRVASTRSPSSRASHPAHARFAASAMASRDGYGPRTPTAVDKIWKEAAPPHASKTSRHDTFVSVISLATAAAAHASAFPAARRRRARRLGSVRPRGTSAGVAATAHNVAAAALSSLASLNATRRTLIARPVTAFAPPLTPPSMSASTISNISLECFASSLGETAHASTTPATAHASTTPATARSNVDHNPASRACFRARASSGVGAAGARGTAVDGNGSSYLPPRDRFANSPRDLFSFWNFPRRDARVLNPRPGSAASSA